MWDQPRLLCDLSQWGYWVIESKFFHMNPLSSIKGPSLTSLLHLVKGLEAAWESSQSSEVGTHHPLCSLELEV